MTALIPLWWLDKFSFREYAMEDCRLGMERMPENSVDLVFTDPPYGKDTISLYADVAPLINRVLKPGGYAFVYASDYWFPLCFNPFQEHMDYFYLFHLRGLKQTLKRAFPKKLMVCEKTLMCFVKKDFPPRDHEWCFNALDSELQRGKHKWQQSTDQAKYILEKFTQPGDTVLDPFLGSGTTLVACKELGRVGIGFENDPECEEIINERLRPTEPTQSTL